MLTIINSMNRKQLITYAAVGLSLYLISTGLSFAIFSFLGNRGQTNVATSPLPTGTQGHFVIDPSIPRTQPCPLNGKMYTKQEEDTWSKRRPLAVMIENHQESRPQSGLSNADIVYEAVAEGGITRFMGVFYCGAAAAPVTLAPVRSARIYFLPWVLEYDALYNHVGGAGLCNDDTVDDRAKALCKIDQWKIKDMDQFGISFPTCYRNYDRLDHPVATEHTMVCFTDKLYKLASERGWTNVDSTGIAWNKNFEQWKFKDDAKESDRGTVASISFAAWKGYEADYGVKWDYDTTTNSYKRTNGGKPHLDLETKEQLTAKAVVIMFSKEVGPLDVHAHLYYNTIGTGDGLLFEDGKATKIKWSKADKSARTKFLDAATGKELSLVRGQIWVELLPTGTQVTY